MLQGAGKFGGSPLEISGQSGNPLDAGSMAGTRKLAAQRTRGSRRGRGVEPYLLASATPERPALGAARLCQGDGFLVVRYDLF